MKKKAPIIDINEPRYILPEDRDWRDGYLEYGKRNWPLLALAIFIIVVLYSCKGRETAPNTVPKKLEKIDSELAKVWKYQYDHLPKFDTKRYLMISYQWGNDGRGTGMGYLCGEYDSFPARSEIINDILADKRVWKSKEHPIIIFSIFEFKDSSDFKNFQK